MHQNIPKNTNIGEQQKQLKHAGENR